MVRRLGSGPAVIVLAWLHGAWRDRQQRRTTAVRGAGCLCVTQRLIAAKTGLWADSVKAALRTLKTEGLIDTTRGDRRTYILLAEFDGESRDAAEEGPAPDAQ